jgi:hypothetical protein
MMRKSYRAGRHVDRGSQAGTQRTQPGGGGMKATNVGEAMMGMMFLGVFLIGLVFIISGCLSLFGA